MILAMGGMAHAAEVPNHPFIKPLVGGVVEEPKPPHAVLDAPCGIAVEPGGGILISDYYLKTVFASPIPEKGGLPNYFPNNGPCALATDGENLYANYWHGGVVNRDFGVIDPDPATGIAVDPATADLYINHRTSIAVYKAPVHSGETPLVIGAGSLVDGYGIAVSGFAATAGYIYVGDASDNTIKIYDPATSLVNPIGSIDGAGTPAGRFVSLRDTSLALEQGTGHLLVVDTIKPEAEHTLVAVDEFNAEGLYRGQLEHEIVGGQPTGIAVDDSTTGNYGQIYVTTGNGTTAVTLADAGPPEDELGELLVFGLGGAGEKLAVTRSGAGQGSVDSDPAGIACPGACEAELNSGAIVTLTATPASGSVFSGWSGAGCTGTGSCQVTLSAAASVNAEFTPAPVLSAVHTAAASVASSQASAPTGSAPALRLGRASAQSNGSVLLHATLPAPGTLSASGGGLRSALAAFADAGPITLRLQLSASGRRALKESKSGHLALRVAVSFEPSQAAPPGPLSKTVTFKRR